MTATAAPAELLLGIDAGTTNLKVVAATPGGRVVKVARRSVRIDRPGPDGASAFDLDQLERDLLDALAAVAAAIDPTAVIGIGVVSVGESFVGVDGEGRRLTDCPTWFDRRTRNTRPDLGLSVAEWFDITGMVDDSGASPEMLWAEAAASPAGARGVRVAAFLEGTGAPWNERDRRGRVNGLSGETTRGDLLRAAAEAIAAWLAVNVRAFERLTGRPIERLLVVGGGARNSLLNEIKAAVLDRPLHLPAVSEAAALGAALVAGLAVGRFATAAEAAALGDVDWHEHLPDAALSEAYARMEPGLAALFPNR